MELLFDKYCIENLPKTVGITGTVVAGVFVFILSQYFLELVIKPYREYKNIKNEIRNKLKYYSDLITSPLRVFNQDILDQVEEIAYRKSVSREIRKLSCDLEVKFYDNHKLIRHFLIKDRVDEAASSLIGLSNSFFELGFVQSQGVENGKTIDNIKSYLNFETPTFRLLE